MALLLVLGVIALLISLNALYVAAEFAAVSARRTRLQEMAESGSRPASLLLGYVEDPVKLDRYIAACQIGITLSSLVVGFYGQAQLAPYLGFGLSVGVATLIALVVLTTLQVVLGELLPKSLAMRYPERWATLTVFPITASLVVLRPLIALFNGSAFALMRLFGVKQEKNTHVHSPEELEYIFRESEHGGYLDVEEREMLENVLQLEQRLGRQIMVPRNRLVMADARRPAGELLAELVETPHMRFPVHEGSVDRIVGILNLKDLFLLAQEDPEADVRGVTRAPLLLPETNTVSEIWEALQGGAGMAVLFDEHGGVSGAVTLEDVIEEIVGEVQDEFDEEARRFAQDGRRVRVRGDVLVAQVNRRLLLDLPEDGADTIGGLFTEALGRAPKEGETVVVEGLELTAERVSDHAVRQVAFDLPDSERGEEAAG